jgi:hypothetical protein
MFEWLRGRPCWDFPRTDIHVAGIRALRARPVRPSPRGDISSTRFPLHDITPNLKNRSSVGDKEAYCSVDISVAGGRFRLKLPQTEGWGK